MTPDQWASLSRFAPEVALVGVIGVFSIKALKLFVEYIEKRDVEQQKVLNKLSKSVDKNTKATEHLNTFMEGLNGKLVKSVKETIRETEK